MKKEQAERTEEMAASEEIAKGSELDNVKPEIEQVDEDSIFDQVEGLKNGEPLKDEVIEEADEEIITEDDINEDDAEEESVEDDTEEVSEDEKNNSDEEEPSEIDRLKAELAKARHDSLSARGAASKAMSELARIKREINQAGGVEQAKGKVIIDESKLKDLEEDYGVNLSSVEEALQNQQIQESKLATLEQELVEAKAILAAQAAKAALMPKYGDIDSITGSKDFATWFDTLEPALQQEGLVTNDPETISTFLDAFIAETGYQTQAQAEQSAQEVNRLKERLEKKKKAAIGVKGRGVAQKISTTKTDYVDEDKIFKEVESRIL